MGLANLSNPLGGSGGSGSGSGSGVTSIIPGAGISVDQATGNVTVTNTGTGSGDMLLAGVQTVTGAKTFGTIGGAVGKLILAGSTSGSSILNAAAVAGSTTIILPNANSTLPIYTQQVTYAGPSAARTVTYPDASFTVARTDAANTFTGTQTITTLAGTSSITGAAGNMTITAGTGNSRTLTLRTTTSGGSATNAVVFDATQGASFVGVLAAAGATISSSTAFITPASTTSVSSLRLPHGSAPTSPVNGDVWTTTSAMFVRINGSSVQLGAASVPGSDTQVVFNDGGAFGADAGMTYNKTTDSLTLAGSLTTGSGASTAGALVLTQGTTQSTGTTNITIQAPTSVTSYIRTLPGSAATGFYLGTNSAGTVTDTQVASVGTGSVVLSAGALAVTTAKTLTVTQSLTLSGTDSTVMTFPTTSATIARTDAANTFTGASATTSWTANTQSVRTNNTTLATTAYADRASLVGNATSALSGTTSTTIDWSLSNSFSLTLGGNLGTVTFSNATDGQTIVVALTNTASNYTVTWGNSIKWVGGSQPVQTVGAKTDIWTITRFGSTYYGAVVQNLS